MANERVNPPPQLRMPKAWSLDPSIRPYQSNVENILFQLWLNSKQAIADNAVSPIQSSMALNALKRLGSGISVTIDTTGFTVDTTKFTTDMTEM
jgi:hypothetical protein